MRDRLASLLSEAEGLVNNDLPTVEQIADYLIEHDVAVVVRCKDCVYCDCIYSKKRIGEEAELDCFCKLYGALVDDDGFCSVGARKEQP